MRERLLDVRKLFAQSNRAVEWVSEGMKASESFNKQLNVTHYSSASAYERPRSRTNRFTNRIVCLLQRTYEIQGTNEGTNFTELQSNNQRLAQPVDNIGVNSDMES
ncbi:uncharacterized protein LOC122539340 isoform X7 [Chiloscyllium plagiosum]|uniref:uncharacterized protein LOC122539340 isoform X7 n=1 Tax=Chiloscyllium plagiosum TaxID=36176 RepID=UPI001CB80A90|nr:uncharacterized protein LOC122539340 isoform X7 [Chiloscyllium plagiosum]